jgi:hypothetical protein
LRKQLRSRPVEGFTDYCFEGLARLQTYNTQASPSEMDSCRLPSKAAADDDSIGLEFRFVFPRRICHEELEIAGRHVGGADLRMRNATRA